jgi:hypothetical protein
MTADNHGMRHLVLVLLVLAAAPVHAGGNNIVIESYTGDRPVDAPRVVNPILGELVSRGYNVGDTLARTYEQKVSGPALTSGGLPADFAVQVDAGFKEWVSGRFDDAIKTLEPLVETAHASSGAFANDQSLREPLQKALIALALAHQRTGDPAQARATLAELLRSNPDATLSRAMYGGEAYELFEQVRRDLVAQGSGKLTIKVTDDTAVVFVDEQYRGVGTTTIDLLPGEYRVCVLLEKHPARTHRVVVRPRGEAVITIDPRLDQAVRTGPWTGLSFASTADREAHEGAYAAAFANSLDATAVAVVGFDTVRGRPAVVGSLVSLQSGREIRRASVALEPDPSTERLRALARYLAGEDPQSGIEVQQPSAAPLPQPTGLEPPHDTVTSTSGGRWGGWKWITGGAGAAALTGGVVLLVLDGRCKNPMTGRACTDVYDNSPIDYIALGAGAALAGVSLYLFATGASHEPAHAAYVVPAHGGALAGFSGRF